MFERPAARDGKYEAEGRRVRKDGSIFQALVVIDPIRDQHGKLIGYAKITRDITERVEAQKALRELPVGGKTPLSSGLYLAWQVIDNARRKDSEQRPLMILLTDGAGNVSMTGMPAQEEAMRIAELFEQASLRSIVVNMEHAAFDRGLANKLAYALGGICYNLPELRADTLLSTVKREIDAA